METTTRRNIVRRTFVLMAALVFVMSAFVGPKSAHAGDPCQGCTTHAIVTCSSARFFGGASWNAPVLDTFYYGEHLGARNLYGNTWTGQYYTQGSFTLVLHYRTNRWGYIYTPCVGGFFSW